MSSEADVEKLRKSIGEFCSKRHQKSGKIASVSVIVRRFKINKAKLYSIFPGGQKEICSVAGIVDIALIPKGPSRLGIQTVVSSIGTDAKTLQNEADTSRLAPTGEPTKEIFGKSPIEGGKNPRELVDRIIEFDSSPKRETPEITLAEESRISGFLKSAKIRGFSDHEFLEYVTRIRNLGIDQLDLATADALVFLVKEVVTRRWNIKDFVDEATRSNNIVNYYMMYLRGQLSASDAFYNIRALRD